MTDGEPTWRHPGGKLRELGPEALSDAELLAIIIGSGIPGRPAESIAASILAHFGSLRGMLGQPLARLLEIRGLADVKVIRIAAVFEIAKRMTKSPEDRNAR